MKAAKKIIPFVFSGLLVFSCTPDKQTPQKLDPITKEYFEVKNGSIYVFTEVSDTNITQVYTSQNYINTQANPDIENNEIMVYDLVSSGLPKFTVRSESGGAQFKDRIALITIDNDTTFIGPITYNVGGTFSTGVNSGDSVFKYNKYVINGQSFDSVVRVKPIANPRYKEVFYAKRIGLIARKEKNNKFYYVKRHRIIK